jgi:hypothetical protein
MVITFIFLFFVFSLTLFAQDSENEWISLFNGENLDGWIIKITGYEINENYKNTFRVEDGILRVS